MIEGQRYMSYGTEYQVLTVEEASPVEGENPGVYYAPVRDGKAIRREVLFCEQEKFKEDFYPIISPFYTTRMCPSNIFTAEKNGGAVRLSHSTGSFTVSYQWLLNNYQPFVGKYVKHKSGSIFAVQRVEKPCRLKNVHVPASIINEPALHDYVPIQHSDLVKPYTYWTCRENGRVYCVKEVGDEVVLVDRQMNRHCVTLSGMEKYYHVTPYLAIPIFVGDTFYDNGYIVVLEVNDTTVKFVRNDKVHTAYRHRFAAFIIGLPWSK